VVVDGHDFFAVYEAAGEAVRRARAGGGPSLLECKVNRYYGHFEGDQQTYRAPGEVEEIRATRDCLDRFTGQVTSRGLIEQPELSEIDAEVKALIEEAVTKARAGELPEPDDLLTDVYVRY
jgi:pyruvate dehydrogenase E1 component alpha subunit